MFVCVSVFCVCVSYMYMKQTGLLVRRTTSYYRLNCAMLLIIKSYPVRSTGAGSQEALSVKKSAEMAALFADVRLSQRTDVRALCGAPGAARAGPCSPVAGPALCGPRQRVPAAALFAHTPLSRNASLEDTLGYLP